jgi:CBS domain-containing protein
MNHAALLEEPTFLTLAGKKASDLMTPNPVSIRDTAPISEARAFLVDRGISGAPVIDAAGRPVGVLTQTDLVIHDRESPKRLGSDRFLVEAGSTSQERPRKKITGEWSEFTKVDELMTPTVFTTRLDSPASQVIADLVSLKIHRLFIVDRNGVLVGVITALDVLRHLHFPHGEDFSP